MEIRQMKSLQAIVATGNFGLAAEQLRLTQSALSHQIKELEEELGTPLLVRARPHVYLTDAGQVLMASVDKIMTELADVRRQFGVHGGDELSIGVVRVAATTIGFSHIYGALCHAFISRFPNAKLDFTAAETPEVGVSKVLTRAVDIAFSPLSLSDNPALQGIALGEAEHIFIVGASHPLCRMKTVTIEHLKRFSFVRYHRSSGSRIVSDGVFLEQGGYPEILTESNDTEFVKRIVSIGLGTALVPIFAVADELRNGTLRAMRLRNQRIIDQFGMLVYKGRSHKLLSEFINVCLECRGPQPRKLTLETIGQFDFFQPEKI
ncbi:LysR family transcriptional regulator [Microbacteriaceae bacterium K1510]|nr:LysR family transcriptional regulator [Microbacteriaceae bacterium K1510]